MNNPSFKGVWTPDFIMEMVWNGELTPTDAFLLSTIHALSKRKEGCTAKRDYLAQCVGVSEGHIKKLIVKYRKMGLVVNLDFNGRTQAIKTCWDNEPRIRQPYHRGHGSSVLQDTPEITSSSSSSTRGVLQDTAHQATYSIDSSSYSKKTTTTFQTDIKKELKRFVIANVDPDTIDEWINEASGVLGQNIRVTHLMKKRLLDKFVEFNLGKKLTPEKVWVFLEKFTKTEDYGKLYDEVEGD